MGIKAANAELLKHMNHTTTTSNPQYAYPQRKRVPVPRSVREQVMGLFLRYGFAPRRAVRATFLPAPVWGEVLDRVLADLEAAGAIRMAFCPALGQTVIWPVLGAEVAA